MPSITIADLTNAKLDVDHIAEVATSPDSTAVDRLGHVKDTLKGAIDSLKAFNSRGAWAAATAYAVKDLVTSGGTWYACVTAHMSSVAFATDSATKWRIHQGLVLADLTAGDIPIKAHGFAVGAPLPGSIARFYANEAISEHAHYGFLDESQIAYLAPGNYGHASFNDNVTVRGAEDIDHHHSYQSYPHYSATGFLNRMSCFWAMPDVTAGIVRELSIFKANNPAGAGGIDNLYGLLIPALTRGAANFAICTEGNTPSKFGGEVQLGGGSAKVDHSPLTQHLTLTPLDGKGVHLAANDMYLGPVAALAVRIRYDPDTGHLILSPRSGYNTELESGDLKIREAGKGVVMSNAAGTITRRVRLNDAGTGLVFE